MKHYSVKEPGVHKSGDEPSAKRRKISPTNERESTTTQASDPNREVDIDGSSSGNSSSDEETEEDDNPSTQNESNKKEGDSPRFPHLSLMNCIALCYLGLLYAEETVLVVDLAR